MRFTRDQDSFFMLARTAFHQPDRAAAQVGLAEPNVHTDSRALGLEDPKATSVVPWAIDHQ
jgi:hypothetical protein